MNKELTEAEANELQTTLLKELDNEDRATTPPEPIEVTPEAIEIRTETTEKGTQGVTQGVEQGDKAPPDPIEINTPATPTTEATTAPPVKTPDATTKVETRGRKKLERDESGNVIRPERPDRSQFKSASLDDVINKGQPQAPPITQPTAASSQQPQTPAKVDISQYISGALALLLIDLFFPAALVFGYNKFYAAKYDKEPLKAAELKLSAKEQKELEPLADAAIKEMMIELSPTKALFIALGVIYGGKMLMLTQDAEK